MKVKTTRKAVINGCRDGKLVSVSYCKLQTLLRNHEPIAYNSGTYGWNFDVYQVNGLTICTGYRNMPGRTPNNYLEYENRARQIADDYSIDFEERSKKIEELLNEFIEQA